VETSSEREKMADDDDWDTVPIQLNIKKPVHFSDEEQEQVEIEEVIASKEVTKPKNVVDEKTALAKAKSASKAKQKEREDELAREAERARNAKPLTAEEKAAEALRLRKLVEEADNELTKDLFSGVAGSQGSGAATGFAAKHADGIQDIDSLSAMLHLVDLSGTKQASELASALSRKLELGTKKVSVSFLKDLLRGSTVSLADEEVNELINLLSVIKNEKVKAKMAKKKTPAAAAPKPKLNTLGLEKPGGDRYDMDDVDERGRSGKKGASSAYDDDDFM
jgi:translation initiation factor 3 subunit J